MALLKPVKTSFRVTEPQDYRTSEWKDLQTGGTGGAPTLSSCKKDEKEGV